MSEDTVWRLFFNAMPVQTATKMIHVEGDVELGVPLLRARAVIV